MAFRTGRFSPAPYQYFNANRAREETPPKARPVPDHLLGSPARVPSHEKALHRRPGRRWLTGRMVRMQAVDDMRPRESRVRKRREQEFDARCPDTDLMKGCIPQLNASGPQLPRPRRLFALLFSRAIAAAAHLSCRP
jgi:hypothetical protein